MTNQKGAGETDLQRLLASMAPVLLDDEFVFSSFDNADYGMHADLQPIASMREEEGLTLVVPKAKADQHKIKYDAVFKALTLQVHSSLEAVGLTAAFANKLAEHGISANVIAGFYHDHIFVQSSSAEKALLALQELSTPGH